MLEMKYCLSTEYSTRCCLPEFTKNLCTSKFYIRFIPNNFNFSCRKSYLKFFKLRTESYVCEVKYFLTIFRIIIVIIYDGLNFYKHYLNCFILFEQTVFRDRIGSKIIGYVRLPSEFGLFRLCWFVFFSSTFQLHIYIIMCSVFPKWPNHQIKIFELVAPSFRQCLVGTTFLHV